MKWKIEINNTRKGRITFLCTRFEGIYRNVGIAPLIPNLGIRCARELIILSI